MGLGKLNPGCGCSCSKDCVVTVGNCYVTWRCEEADSVELWWKTPSTGILVHTATNGTYRPAFTGMYTLRSIKNGVTTDQTFTVTAVNCPTCCTVNSVTPKYATITGLPPWCSPAITLQLKFGQLCRGISAEIIARNILVTTDYLLGNPAYPEGLYLYVDYHNMEVRITFSETTYPVIYMRMSSSFYGSYATYRGVRQSPYFDGAGNTSFGQSGSVVGLYGAAPTTGFLGVVHSAYNEGCSLPSGFSQEYRATWYDLANNVHELWRGSISVIFHE